MSPAWSETTWFWDTNGSDASTLTLTGPQTHWKETWSASRWQDIILKSNYKLKFWHRKGKPLQLAHQFPNTIIDMPKYLTNKHHIVFPHHEMRTTPSHSSLTPHLCWTVKFTQKQRRKQKPQKEFINEHVEKGYIMESNSLYVSPFFFRKKKDGKLHPIIDYKVLNSLTIWDTYPLPLINTILEHLEGKALFTKFDIQ